MNDRLQQALAVGLLLTASLAGCGGDGLDRAEVQGTVTFDGAPIESGSIAFIPEKGTAGPSTGGPIRDGKYHLTTADGPVVGPHRVEIRATRPTGRTVKEGSGGREADSTVAEIEMFIPQKYNSDSTLTADVQPGENTFDFALEDGTGPQDRRRTAAPLP